MYGTVRTAIVNGIDTLPVQVEADVSDGLPVFDMVGFLGSEVKEARERVRTAMRNSGFEMPVKRITVNLTPADRKKSGSAFDLAIALALLSACGYVAEESLRSCLVAGEISLDGSVRPVRGIFPMCEDAAKEGVEFCMVPYENRHEAALADHVRIVPVKSLREAVEILNGEAVPEEEEEEKEMPEEEESRPDFSDIAGQKVLKRACEVAVAGMHNLLMIGSAGAGKSMAAQRIPSILPPLDREEQMELLRIRSVAGLLGPKEGLSSDRPFRSPHHTISAAGMAGGGNSLPRPGEISMAHHGVLFLDELTEFMPSALELLRQPMEERKITLVRSGGSFTYPADFMLVCAMNPCQCGEYPDRNKCRCTRAQIERFIGRISKPILDRMDLCVETPRVEFSELMKRTKKEESSETIRKRILKAHKIQEERYEKESFRYNSEIPAKKIDQYVELGAKEQEYMQETFGKLNLSVRGYHKVLKVARTIADLKGQKMVDRKDLAEASCYRSLDKSFWER